MKIKINEQNRAAINAALDAANGRATAHTFTGATPIIEAAIEAESKLAALGLTKAQRQGAIAHTCSGGSVPHSYKYKRLRTYFTLLRGGKDWSLSSVTASQSWDRSAGATCVCLTPEQDQAATEKFRARYFRQPAVAKTGSSVG